VLVAATAIAARNLVKRMDSLLTGSLISKPQGSQLGDFFSSRIDPY
jgi:hypothetical protein